METIEFITPSGHKVYINPYLTFGQSRAVEKLWISTMKVTVGKKEDAEESPSSVDGSVVYEAQDLTVKFLVEKIVTSDGKEFAGDSVLEVIGSMKDEDGRAIYNKIDEITAAKRLPPEESDAKKK